MRFTWDQGSGAFGQVNPRAPRRLDTYQGMPMGGMQGQGLGWGGGMPGVPASTAGMSPGVLGGMPTVGMSAGMPGRMPPAGMPAGVPGGMPPVGMPVGVPGRMPPTGMPAVGGPGFGPMGPSPGGTIRNNLGSELKKRGVFQKDGHINNLRGGFFGAKPHKQMAQPQGGGNMGVGPFSFLGSGGGPGASGMQPRQLILEAAQPGMNANGIASISPDNVFSCIANLPSPSTLVGRGGTYAAYLVDSKGQSGFLAGILRPVGNGVYQAQFRSQVPLNHYSRVIVTVENPQQLGHVPQGPIILQVKQAPGPMRFLAPVKKAGQSVWGKISGLIQRRTAASEVVEDVVSGGEAVLGGDAASGVELSPEVIESATEINPGEVQP